LHWSNSWRPKGVRPQPEEQALLAKFTGWGASEIRNKLFPQNAIRRNADGQRELIPLSYGDPEWLPLQKRAAELLKGSDLEEALQSTQYAHYTSPAVIRSIWDGLERLGFGGGKVLEPGMGIGNFFMLAPDSVHDVSHYTGIELDGFTAKIAKYLLPQESVIHGDYTKTKLPNGFFDVAIGNPPFANIKVLDDPDYKKQRFSLHDYFFAKSIDKVRPGGLLVFVTSRYTMDKLDQKAREYIADRADLIGAVRLPQTAFKENAGTEVVTDVLFLQKRHDGVPRGGEDWLRTDQITAQGNKFQINEYFKRHPEMVLGKHSAQGSMYSEERIYR
jgi:type I restriction-modification system DNA methylase subunit